MVGPADGDDSAGALTDRLTVTGRVAGVPPTRPRSVAGELGGTGVAGSGGGAGAASAVEGAGASTGVVGGPAVSSAASAAVSSEAISSILAEPERDSCARPASWV